MKPIHYFLLPVFIFSLLFPSSQTQAAGLAVGSDAVTTLNLNVRSAPSLNADVVGVAYAGTKGTLMAGPSSASGHTWWQINYTTGQKGWSSDIGLAPTTTAPPPSPDPNAPSSQKFAAGDRVTVSSQLNIRSSSSFGFNILDTAYPGDKGSVVSGPASGNGYSWWQVKWDKGVTGWSIENYLVKSQTSTAPPPPTPPPPAPPPSTQDKFTAGNNVTVNSWINIRSSASFGFNILDTASPGDKGAITSGPASGNGYSWWQVKWDKGVTGWSVENYLVKSTASPPPSQPQISSINPSSGPVSTSVTIQGSGFTASGNTVNFGSLTIPNLSSANGTSLAFTVPANAALGANNVSVMNANGTSNRMSFMVTAASNSSVNLLQVKILKGAGNPRIIYVNGLGFDALRPQANAVMFGDITLAPPIAVQTLTQNFYCTDYSCYEPGVFAPGTQLFSVGVPENRFVPGTYSVSVRNASGVSNTVSVTITQSMIPASTNDQIGNIRVGRVGSDSTTATAPATNASIDVDTSLDPRNPADYVGIPIGAHTVYATDIAGYSERAGICTYAIGTSECSVTAFPLLPSCSVSPSQLGNVPSSTCTVWASVSKDQVTKVVFQYTVGTLPPPPQTGNVRIIGVIFPQNERTLFINGTGFVSGPYNTVSFGSIIIPNVIGNSPLSNSTSIIGSHGVLIAAAGTQLIGTPIPTANFVPGTYDVFVTNAQGTSNTVQVIIFPDMIPSPPSLGQIPDPSTMPFKIQYPNGALAFQSPGYLNGENLIIVEGSRVKKGVVFDFFKSDRTTQTGTVPAQPTDYSLDQACGPLDNYNAHLWCKTAFWLTLGNNPAAAGSYFVRARNPDGAVSNLLPFEIVGGSQLITNFLVDGTSGFSAIQGKSNTLDILGANFVSGGTVTIRNAICGIVFCTDEAGNSNPVTLPYEFISPGHLKVKWTPPIYNPTPESVLTDPRGYNIQINNPDGSHSSNFYGIFGTVPSLPWPQPPGLQYSVSPIIGKVGTTFSLCTNNPITKTLLIVTTQNGAQMVAQAQSGGNCPSGQSGLSFTMGSTINAIPGFAEYNGNSYSYPQSFNVVPGFYKFDVHTDKKFDDKDVVASGKEGQTWTIEVTR